jgi:hypothetical protein
MNKHTPEFIEIMTRYKNQIKENKTPKINILQILEERNRELMKDDAVEEIKLDEIVHFEGVDNKTIQNRLKLDDLNKKKNRKKMHLRKFMKLLEKENERSKGEIDEKVEENFENTKGQLNENGSRNISSLTKQNSFITDLALIKLPKICKFI